MRTLLVAAAALVLLCAGGAPAKAIHGEGWGSRFERPAVTPARKAHGRAKREKRPRTRGRAKRATRAYRSRLARGVHPRLVRAFSYVARRCSGARIVSGVRRTYVRGARRRIRSLHWSGNALDFRVNSYACAYRALKAHGWRWGMSRDGRRCGHIHISYGGHRRERHGFRHYRC